MLVPHHRNPLSREQDNIPPILGIGYHWQLQKHPFPGFLGKSSRDPDQKYPSFPRKWERACGPLMHSRGVGGGGGGGVHLTTHLHINVMLRIIWVFFGVVGFIGVATKKASCLWASNQGTCNLKSFPRDYEMRIECIAQGHSRRCRCQQILNRGPVSYSLSHDSSSSRSYSYNKLFIQTRKNKSLPRWYRGGGGISSSVLSVTRGQICSQPIRCKDFSSL